MKLLFLAFLVGATAVAATTCRTISYARLRLRRPRARQSVRCKTGGGIHRPFRCRAACARILRDEGNWKIRFSPTRIVEWSLRTVSSLAALDGKTEVGIGCTANHDPEIHGGLRVDPEHPHHFIYEDGTRYFLLGYEADWLRGADMLDPARKVMYRLIDQMAERGFNHVMVNV
jgi:hypothetical protein